MDYAPPPSAVEATTHETEAALSPLRHLHASRDWVARQAREAPALDAGDASEADALSRLDAWWNEADDAGVQRSLQLASHIGASTRQSALLRVADGTIDPRMAAVARRLDDAGRTDAPPHLHAREVLLGGAPYAGAVAVRDDREPDMVALFMPDSGWMTLASDEALLGEVRHRIAMRGPGGAPGVGDDAFDDALAFEDVALRDVTGAVFAIMASRILEVQRQHVAAAWDDYRLDGATDDAATRRNDRLREAARLDTYLDLDGMLSRRDERLVEHLHGRRLARAPSAVAREWRDARTAYRQTLEDTGDLRKALGHPQALELAQCAPSRAPMASIASEGGRSCSTRAACTACAMTPRTRYGGCSRPPVPWMSSSAAPPSARSTACGSSPATSACVAACAVGCGTGFAMPCTSIHPASRRVVRPHSRRPHHPILLRRCSTGFPHPCNIAATSSTARFATIRQRCSGYGRTARGAMSTCRYAPRSWSTTS